MHKPISSSLRFGLLFVALSLKMTVNCQCTPSGLLEELWYGTIGGSCSNGNPEAAFFPSFPKCNGQSDILLFDEEFNGSALDGRAWEIQPWGQGALSTANIQEYNSLDNVVVQNGTCKVTAKRQTVVRRAIAYLGDNEILSDGLPNLREYDFTSSNIWSLFRFGQGVYEIRFKIDLQHGMFPAFWIFSSVDGTWNEIDWFEMNGQEPNTWLGTLHHDSYAGSASCDNFCAEAVQNAADFGEWHVIKGVYDFDHISWYLDGALLHKKTRYTTAAGHSVECGEAVTNQTLFQPPYWPNYGGYIIFNMAVYRGANAPLSEFVSADYEIDYIKYYKKDPCCGDIFISDNSGLGLNNDPEVYNYMCASNITLGSNVELQDGQNLALIAIEEIDLQPGLEISSGAYFNTSIQPEVVPCCDIVVVGERPNVFTPNGDGVNDNYCIQATGATSYNVTVTTGQWNVPVYSGSGSINPGQSLICVWDGGGTESGEIFNILIELKNDCTEGQGTLIGGYVHVFKSVQIDPNVNGAAAQLSSGSEPAPLVGDSSARTGWGYSNISVPTWDFVLTPNPASNEVALVLDTELTLKPGDVSMRGVLGNELQFTTELTNFGAKLRFSQAKEGVYFVTVTHKGDQRSHRIVINGLAQ